MVDRVLGVILAGGLARRMGGCEKARLDLGGQSLIGKVISRIKPQCDALILNANGEAARFADLGLPVVADTVPGFPGPLAGVLAGMEQAAICGFSHVLTVAADTPFLPPDLLERLEAAVRRDERPIGICATRDGGRMIRHPTFGLWPVDLRADLRHALKQGLFKMTLWAERHGIALAEFETRVYDPFFNINTPEDLQLARAVWKSMANSQGQGIPGRSDTE